MVPNIFDLCLYWEKNWRVVIKDRAESIYTCTSYSIYRTVPLTVSTVQYLLQYLQYSTSYLYILWAQYQASRGLY